MVTGPPASGKGSIEQDVAEALPAPLLAKDAIKEALFDGLGTGDVEWSQKLEIATCGIDWNEVDRGALVDRARAG